MAAGIYNHNYLWQISQWRAHHYGTSFVRGGGGVPEVSFPNIVSIGWLPENQVLLPECYLFFLFFCPKTAIWKKKYGGGGLQPSLPHALYADDHCNIMSHKLHEKLRFISNIILIMTSRGLDASFIISDWPNVELELILCLIPQSNAIYAKRPLSRISQWNLLPRFVA